MHIVFTAVSVYNVASLDHGQAECISECLDSTAAMGVTVVMGLSGLADYCQLPKFQ